MSPTIQLINPQFPRSNKYHPDWVIANVSGGANSLWLAEWLSTAMDLQPGMRVLDLGCGRASSSIFMHREYGVEVWATDLWCSVSENSQRIMDAGVANHVFPIHSDARSLPFAADFFDAIVSLDSFMYFGTDDLYLSYLARFLKPSGMLGIAGAGLMQEIVPPIPAHLKEWWTPDLWCLHTAGWWQLHWERTDIVDVILTDTMPDGWQHWIHWHKEVAPDNRVEIEALQVDRGRYLGYIRTVARRCQNVKLEEPLLRLPSQYTSAPLLRGE